MILVKKVLLWITLVLRRETKTEASKVFEVFETVGNEGVVGKEIASWNIPIYFRG